MWPPRERRGRSGAFVLRSEPSHRAIGKRGRLIQDDAPVSEDHGGTLRHGAPSINPLDSREITATSIAPGLRVGGGGRHRRALSGAERRGLPALAWAPAPNILANVVMATSVHIPKPLLDAVDRRARALHISRNRLILKALERELQEDPGWSAGFFEQLAAPNKALADAAGEMIAHIRTSRRSKKAVRL